MNNTLQCRAKLMIALFFSCCSLHCAGAQQRPLLSNDAEMQIIERARQMRNEGVMKRILGAPYTDDAIRLLIDAIGIIEAGLGKGHHEISQPASDLADLLKENNRYVEAERFYNLAIETDWNRGDPPPTQLLLGLAEVYHEMGRYEDAEAILLQAERGGRGGHSLQRQMAKHYIAIGNLREGHRRSELAAISAVGDARRASFNLRHNLLQDAESLGTEHYYQDFVRVVRTSYLSWTKDPNTRDPLLSKAFEFAQWASASSAGAALALMSARQSAPDAELERVVREQQDALASWQRLNALDLKNELVLGQMRELDLKLRNLDELLGDRFPKFRDLGRIEAVSLAEVQGQLDLNEAFVYFFDTTVQPEPAPEETFVWVVTKTNVRWMRSGIGSAALKREVAALRCGLDVNAWIGATCLDLTKAIYTNADREMGRPPPFEPERAHALYMSLLGEAADILTGKHLLVVPSGALTTLPFHVLVTEPPKAEDLQSVRWLARDHAITVLPSVSSLKALRRSVKPSVAPKPMIGFGNPLLDGDQAHPQYGAQFREQATIARAQTGCAKTRQKRTASLRVVARSLAPLPVSGRKVDLNHLRMQAPLPETADELCEVARSVGGSVDDVRIGARATETEVKRLSFSGELAKYRILHFATHGTLAGQLKGTSEPGLILTPPKTATDEDDGYLSGSEIASLKLDADWVILSACNTAGGAREGEAAEALSGLARMFFYAGARALLVSHWEVDSDAAVKLVTSATAELSKTPVIGRAEALRRAMLVTMQDTSRPKNWAPAAHPSVWAPFVVVGEGGTGR